MGFEKTRHRSVVPVALGLAMLGVLLAGAVAPNTGAVPVDTQCPYGVCPAPTNNLLPWEIAFAVLVLVAIALALLIILRRRRGGRGGAPGPVEPWSGRAPPAGAEGPQPPSAVDAAVPAAGAAAYLETPEDFGTPPPTVAGPVVPSPPPAEGAEADIDSLMQELDKISNEILKRGGPKTGKGSETNGEAEDQSGGGGTR